MTRRGAGWHRRWIAPTVLFFLMLRFAGAAQAGKPGAALRWLQDHLTKLAADPRLKTAKVGIAVLDGQSDKVLFSLHADELFNVASNVKLITTAAALSLLGPEFRMKTILYAAPRQVPLVEGDLYLKGFGDPTLDESDLWEMASDLYDKGIRQVKGKLVIDESYFDTKKLAPLFDEKSTDMWYRSPNGALSLNYNSVAVQVLGGDGPGLPARIIVQPHVSLIQLKNEVKTIEQGKRSWIGVRTRRRKMNIELQVTGRAAPGFRSKWERRRIDDPGRFTGQVFLERLIEKGIKFDQPRVARGKVPPQARAILYALSDPLAMILRRVNKKSDNFMAEQILKILGAEVYGAPASWEKGLKALSQYLTLLKIPPQSYTIKNGSGLYDATRLSPRQLVKVIAHATRDFKIGPEFISTLPLAGVDGTLRKRFVGSPAERLLRAKTGTLKKVIALSGLAGKTSPTGTLFFSICVNDFSENKAKDARAVVDEMASALVTYLEGGKTMLPKIELSK